MVAAYVQGLQRSQFRKFLLEKLASIHPDNRPFESSINYGTEVRSVSMGWTTEDEAIATPAIQVRLDSTTYNERQSRTLGATVRFEIRIIVGADDVDTAYARLEILRDDVIGAVYDGYRSGGNTFAIRLLSEVEIAPTAGTIHMAIMTWEALYTRSYRLEREDT